MSAGLGNTLVLQWLPEFQVNLNTECQGCCNPTSQTPLCLACSGAGRPVHVVPCSFESEAAWKGPRGHPSKREYCHFLSRCQRPQGERPLKGAPEMQSPMAKHSQIHTSAKQVQQTTWARGTPVRTQNHPPPPGVFRISPRSCSGSSFLGIDLCREQNLRSSSHGHSRCTNDRIGTGLF